MIPKKIVFKVKYGYNAGDFVLVSNVNDLERALYAKANKIGVTIGGKMISGQEIKTIEPDIHSYTGWYRSYEPTTADDFKQIERDVPDTLYQMLDVVSHHVNNLIMSGDIARIGKETIGFEQLMLQAGNDVKRVNRSQENRGPQSMKELVQKRAQLTSPKLEM